MYCQSCGTLNDKDNLFCIKCGKKLVKTDSRACNVNANSNNVNTDVVIEKQANSVFPNNEPQINVKVNVTPNTDIPSHYEMSSSDKTLRLIAFIFNLVFTIMCGLLILPLAWMIPMTVRSYRIYSGKRPNTIAFGVCTLIFLCLVSGILLLCSKKDLN